MNIFAFLTSFITVFFIMYIIRNLGNFSNKNKVYENKIDTDPTIEFNNEEQYVDFIKLNALQYNLLTPRWRHEIFNTKYPLVKNQAVAKIEINYLLLLDNAMVFNMMGLLRHASEVDVRYYLSENNSFLLTTFKQRDIQTLQNLRNGDDLFKLLSNRLKPLVIQTLDGTKEEYDRAIDLRLVADYKLFEHKSSNLHFTNGAITNFDFTGVTDLHLGAIINSDIIINQAHDVQNLIVYNYSGDVISFPQNNKIKTLKLVGLNTNKLIGLEYLDRNCNIVIDGLNLATDLVEDILDNFINSKIINNNKNDFNVYKVGDIVEIDKTNYFISSIFPTRGNQFYYYSGLRVDEGDNLVYYFNHRTITKKIALINSFDYNMSYHDLTPYLKRHYPTHNRQDIQVFKREDVRITLPLSLLEKDYSIQTVAVLKHFGALVANDAVKQAEIKPLTYRLLGEEKEMIFNQIEYGYFKKLLLADLSDNGLEIAVADFYGQMAEASLIKERTYFFFANTYRRFKYHNKQTIYTRHNLSLLEKIRAVCLGYEMLILNSKPVTKDMKVYYNQHVHHISEVEQDNITIDNGIKLSIANIELLIL